MFLFILRFFTSNFSDPKMVLRLSILCSHLKVLTTKLILFKLGEIIPTVSSRELEYWNNSIERRTEMEYEVRIP